MKKIILIIFLVIVLFFGISLIVGHDIYKKDIETKQKELTEIQQKLYEQYGEAAPPCCKPPYGMPITHSPTERFFLNLYIKLLNQPDIQMF